MKKLILVAALVTAIAYGSRAQTDPLSAQYYTNQYIGNPAMAGFEQGLTVNGVLRKMFSSFPGSPISQSVSADYGFEKVGLGVNFFNDAAGLLRQSRFVGTFAYHLPLNSRDMKLNFGLSLGLLNQRLDNAQVIGNPNDALVGQYNDRQNFLDGDMGVAFTTGRLNIQGALPNLKNIFRRKVVDQVDMATFYTAVSYKIPFGDGADDVMVEPKVAFRGVKGFDNIFDAGAQLYFSNQQLFLTGIYHSTNSATFGLGMNFRQKYLISGLYTSQTTGMQNYSGGNFEVNLRVSVGK